MKYWFIIAVTFMLSTFSSADSFAGQWQDADVPDGNLWWYEEEDGSYINDGWYWLDGNQDGIAECYYFGADGWLLTDTVTPDGYIVNQDGAWIADGQVQARTFRPAGNRVQEGDMIRIMIIVGERQFQASLIDNQSTKALIAQMPMTVTMNEMNGNEKYYYLPSSLPTNAQNTGSIHEGDLMLYGSDCLVLFYEDFRSSYRYTRLGNISDPSGLSQALGSGSVQVTFQLAALNR